MPEAIPVFDDSDAITIEDDESDPTALVVGRTFELSLHVPPRIANGRNMRQIDEG
jgi:hypothetical protein